VKGRNLKMKKGDYVKTPRFLTVKIEDVFEDMEIAMAQGYKEPTHFEDENYKILGKHTGTNTMIFAAIKIKN
jgi:hypothetical protein